VQDFTHWRRGIVHGRRTGRKVLALVSLPDFIPKSPSTATPETTVSTAYARHLRRWDRSSDRHRRDGARRAHDDARGGTTRASDNRRSLPTSTTTMISIRWPQRTANLRNSRKSGRSNAMDDRRRAFQGFSRPARTAGAPPTFEIPEIGGPKLTIRTVAQRSAR